MRIISREKDYYDCCTDPTDTVNVYLRSKEVYDGWVGGEKYKLDEEIGPFIDFRYIGFCGKIYPYVHFVAKKKRTLEITEDVHVYDIEVLEELAEKYKPKKKPKYYYRPRIEKTIEFWRRIIRGEPIPDITRCKQVFEKYHTPVFMVYREKFPQNLGYYGAGKHLLAINCSLCERKFAKVFPTYLAAQQIEMYLFGVLGSQQRERVPIISNEDMIKAKGFDLKTSFRQPKKRR